jgi:hypothetical protein
MSEEALRRAILRVLEHPLVRALAPLLGRLMGWALGQGPKLISEFEGQTIAQHAGQFVLEGASGVPEQWLYGLQRWLDSLQVRLGAAEHTQALPTEFRNELLALVEEAQRTLGLLREGS